mgnify:CR=1 FL=1
MVLPSKSDHPKGDQALATRNPFSEAVVTYILLLKDNQKRMYEEAQAYLLKIEVADGQSYEVDTYHETNTGHRRIEVLHYTLIDMQ